MRSKDRFAELPVWLVAVQLAVFSLLVCMRMPMIISSGRFWAEEGRHFFENAWVMAPLPALFASFAGYLNLVANAAALAARWLVPLPFAPFLTIGTGLAFQLLPPLLLLTARDPWLRPFHARLMAVTLLLLVPASEEIWLQTLTSQFELLSCCSIILALDMEVGWRAWTRLAILGLAPLCSPVAIVLIPLFLLRSAFDRSPPRLSQTATLTATGLLQTLLFLHGDPGRQYALHPVLLLCAFTVRHLALPLFGVDIANRVAALIRASLQESQIPLFAVWPALLVFTLLFAAAFWRRSVSPAIWFVTTGALIAVASYVGSLGGVASLLGDVRGQGRYVVVPQTLFYLGVLALTVTAEGRMKRLGWVVVLWLSGVGAYSYCHPFMAEGPSWRDEITLWQADPSHVIQLWPAGWAMTLDRLHRAPGSY
jgi:hypothetical protein